MTINPAIFKAYDIRAVYPDDLDQDGIYKIGRAFVEFLGAKEVVIGNDMRNAVPFLKPHLIAGINDAGAKVIDIGMTGTEVMYFATGHYNHQSGMMLTASHNPAKYIGIKMVRQGGIPISGDTGIMAIRDLAVKNEYKRSNLPSSVTIFDPIPDYITKIKQLVDFSKFKHLKIVIDAGNGMGGWLFNKVFADTNLQIIPMYFEPNGNFPNHEANPIIESNTAELRKRVVDEKADFGIALDGDGDRVFFIDGHGNYTLGYYLVAELAKIMLQKYPGATIVHENRNVWAIEDAIKENSGTSVLCQAGYSFLKEKMRETNAVFSGETSSHFFYKDLYYADSSMLSIALLIESLVNSGKTLYEVLEPYREKYFISGEINFTVKNADNTLAYVENEYSKQNYPIDHLDGVAVDKDRDWRLSLRKSNTEPVVRLNVEAKSQDLVDQITAEVSKLITSTA